MRLPAALWTVGGLCYLVAETVSALHYPGYDYARDLISDLGTAGSPLAIVMNAGFVANGVLFASAAVTLPNTRRGKAFLALSACYGVGMVLVGVFQSGASLHTVGAAMALVGGNAALVVARWGRPVVTVLGVVGLVAVAVFVVTDTGAVWERVSAYTIVAGEFVLATALARCAGMDR